MQMFGRAPRGLMALALMLVAAAAITKAQTTTLAPTLTLRPVTSGDIAAYKLPATTQLSGAMQTVALGEPLYLEVEVDGTIPAGNIGGVVWQLTTKPAGSAAALADSPLPANMPINEPADRVIYQVAERKLLKPDVAGRYVVTATVSAGSSGTTTLTQTYTAGTYMGADICSMCHGGHGNIAKAEVPTWSKTGHANIFKQGIDGVLGDHYGASCLGCHTAGYDTNNKVDNGGFLAVATELKWTFPTVLKAGNFAALPDQLKSLGGIQCENCHGPGSEHAYNGGDTSMITVPAYSGACNKCHDAPTHHIKGTEWYSSAHAVTTRDPSGAGREGCVGCHTSNGFIQKMSGAKITDTAYGAIACFTCHEPHGQTTPATSAHLIRNTAAITLADGTKVTTGGEGLLCMNCHQSRQKASTYAASTAGSAHFGPHHGPQGDMIAGANGFTYGQDIPTSAHQYAVKDTCVACHMQTVATTDPGFLQVGGHTFKIAATPTGAKTEEQLVTVCQGCHGPGITTFDFPLFDYDGDGKIEGVQTEVQHLMDQLSSMLPPDNKPKTSLTIDSTWTQPQLEAAYNWLFIHDDGSRGVHNTAYAVGLLKGSIADLKSKGK